MDVAKAYAMNIGPKGRQVIAPGVSRGLAKGYHDEKP